MFRIKQYVCGMRHELYFQVMPQRRFESVSDPYSSIDRELVSIYFQAILVQQFIHFKGLEVLNGLNDTQTLMRFLIHSINQHFLHPHKNHQEGDVLYRLSNNRLQCRIKPACWNSLRRPLLQPNESGSFNSLKGQETLETQKQFETSQVLSKGQMFHLYKLSGSTLHSCNKLNLTSTFHFWRHAVVYWFSTEPSSTKRCEEQDLHRIDRFVKQYTLLARSICTNERKTTS